MKQTRSKHTAAFKAKVALAADITYIPYIPMARCFLYLVAITDWLSRYVLAWRLSNTMGADKPEHSAALPCISPVRNWIQRHGAGHRNGL